MLDINAQFEIEDAMAIAQENQMLVAFAGKVTIAAMRINNDMARISIAYCHDNDKFNPITGAVLAVNRMNNGESIMIPTVWMSVWETINSFLINALGIERTEIDIVEWRQQ